MAIDEGAGLHGRVKRRQTKRGEPAPSLTDVIAGAIGHPRVLADHNFAAEHVFFCDETGNSGSKFFGPEQPVYAEGGWILPVARIAEASAAVVELEKSAGFDPATKGSQLKRSAFGLNHIARMAAMLSALGRPFLYVVEKRYAVCAKAVETFFDPAYNPVVTPSETFVPQLRQQRAEIFYSSDSVLIAAFAAAYRERDAQGVAEAGEAWRDYFMEQGCVPFAVELDQSLRHIEEHVADEFAAFRSERMPRGYDSLNLPALVRVFQLVDEAFPRVEIVHDECATFETVYRHAFQRLRQATPQRIEYHDGRVHTLGFDRLQSLRFARSQDEPLVRAADCLVAVCVEFARVMVRREKPSRDLQDCAGLLIGPHHGDAIALRSGADRVTQLAEFFAADVWLSAVFGRAFPQLRKRSRASSRR